MAKLFIPKDYTPIIDYMESQRAIKKIKDFFQQELAYGLKLRRVSAPLFVRPESGLNDNLNGVERPVDFTIKDMDEAKVQIVQSLAKWKRMALGKYGIKPGHGIYTDMNALRPDDDVDAIHSIYVDQWDWERVIGVEDRNLDFLKSVVKDIYAAIKRTAFLLSELYPELDDYLPENITFIHSEDAARMYPDKTPNEREYELAKKYGAIFLIGIGYGNPPHSGRAPDYDDWSTETYDDHHGLNGDIIVWDKVRGANLELSSMGIRVNKESLLRQLTIRNLEARKDLYWHKRLLCGEFPETIGGGIGQSRLCMFLLHKAHIGEVQASIWPEETLKEAKEKGIYII